MADDIRIRVGVDSRVKAGMDQVTRDVGAGADRASQRIAKGMGGRAFGDALTKALRGDILGALDQASAAVMESSMALGVKMAGAIAAGFAGYNLGKALDERFKISDKIGNFFANRFGTREDEGIKARLEELQTARREREAAEALKAKQLEEGVAALKKLELDTLQEQTGEMQEQERLQKQMLSDAQRELKAHEAIRDAREGGGRMARVFGFRVGGETIQDRADRLTAEAADPRLRRANAGEERDFGQRVQRYERRLATARRMQEAQVGGAGIVLPKWAQALLDAEAAQGQAAQNAENIMQRRKMVEDATVKSAALLDQIKTNTAKLKALEDLLTLKGP